MPSNAQRRFIRISKPPAASGQIAGLTGPVESGRHVETPECYSGQMKNGYWIAIGIAIGVTIGVVQDNIAMGIGIGVAIGIALGLANR